MGTTYTVKVTDYNGATYEYSVELVTVLQQAAPAGEFDAAPAGRHLAGAEFRVIGISGQGKDNANVSATAVGSNQQVYDAGFSALAAGTNFNAGDITVAPGETLVGWVTFEVPDGVTITSVKWQPDPIAPPATWNLS